MIIPVPYHRAGFTASRNGISSFQRQNLMRLLVRAKPAELAHGDCLGGDAEAHMMCMALDIFRRVRPPDNDRYRAFCGLADADGRVFVHPPEPYLARDRQIVHGCDYLIACPQPGSRGTRYTVGYARQENIPVWLLHPDGRVEVDR